MTSMVNIEICKNIAGGMTLCASNEDFGERISGAKVGGCETIKTFTVDAENLIRAIKAHMTIEEDND